MDLLESMAAPKLQSERILAMQLAGLHSPARYGCDISYGRIWHPTATPPIIPRTLELTVQP